LEYGTEYEFETLNVSDVDEPTDDEQLVLAESAPQTAVPPTGVYRVDDDE